MSKVSKEGMDFLAALEKQYGMNLNGTSEVELYRLRKTMWLEDLETVLTKPRAGNKTNHVNVSRKVKLNKRQVVELYKEHSINEITAILHTSNTRIGKILRAEGLIIDRQTDAYKELVKPRLEDVYGMRAKGYTRYQIANELGVEYGTFSAQLRRCEKLRQVYDAGAEQWHGAKGLLRENTLKERVRSIKANQVGGEQDDPS